MLGKRRFIITAMIIITIVLILSGSFLCYRYINASKNKYITYTEDSNLDYKVVYSDNQFFDSNYLEKDNKYIANLIDYIKTDFKYNIKFSKKDLKYSYSYKIIANVSVLDGSDNSSLYKENETIFESQTINATGISNINKSVNVDYKKYNKLINSFNTTYDLKDVNSTLTVSMYISMNSTGNEEIEDLNKNAVISFKIPLTKKTIGVDINSDLSKRKDRKLLIKNNGNYLPILLVGCSELILAFITILMAIIYYKKTRTVKSIYDKEIKKITNVYNGYIQKINSKYEIGTSQVIKIDKFDDMLEIKETLKTPILMLENERKDGTFFIIPASNGVIYAHALRMVDIIARKRGEEAPDYDLKNINKKLPKKYTSEFIDRQIEETRSMRAIDIDNTIRGNKDKKDDLYQQLNKTKNMSKKKKVTKNTKK